MTMAAACLKPVRALMKTGKRGGKKNSEEERQGHREKKQVLKTGGRVLNFPPELGGLVLKKQ